MRQIKETIMKKYSKLLLIFLNLPFQLAASPLGLFEAYDSNIRLKYPAKNHFYFNVLGEKSYNVKGYATDCSEELTQLVNPLQIYEIKQNLIALYQDTDSNKSKFISLLNSIAGGAGGGVGNSQNGLFTPTGKFSTMQAAFTSMYSFDHGFYIKAMLPIYTIALDSVVFEYAGNNTLFSGAQIQELVNTFRQDVQNLFNLNVGNWSQTGLGDLNVMLEWQQDFAQYRPILKSVQPNIRLGITLPTSSPTNESNIMSIPFGNEGSVSLPFGGGLGINLANHFEIGFSGQFWYYWSNQKERRIKTFTTQTSLLYPTITQAVKEYAFLQNFNLYAQIFSFCKRFSLKFCYQYWRKGEDKITPINSSFNYDIVNSAAQLLESTQHNVFFTLNYSPKKDDFSKIIPQVQLFWKAAVRGMRSAIASTVGAQISCIF